MILLEVVATRNANCGATLALSVLQECLSIILEQIVKIIWEFQYIHGDLENMMEYAILVPFELKYWRNFPPFLRFPSSQWTMSV